MEKLGFRRSKYDFCLYVGKGAYLALFVDDALITGEKEAVNALLKALSERFKIKHLGEASSFLGMQLTRNENNLIISQPAIISRLLKEFNMEQCRSTSTPMEVNFSIPEDGEIIDVPYRRLVCSLMYIAISTRPDISFSVAYLSRFLDKPTEMSWKAAKRVLRYLSCTRDLGLRYRRGHDSLHAMSDADWGGDKLSRRSVSGFVAFHGNNAVAWHSKKQNCIALSSMEAEYISASSAAQEIQNLKGVLSEFSESGIGNESVVLNIDNQSAISMVNTFENSKRAKHIDIRYHYIKDLVVSKKLMVKYVSSDKNVADIFTKPLGKEKFTCFRNRLL